MKSTFLKRILTILLLALLVSAILALVAFSYIGRDVFAEMKAKELSPRADFIAYFAAAYQQGTITTSEFRRILTQDTSIWDASVYVYNSDSDLIAWPNSADSDATAETLNEYLPRVRLGNRIVASDTKDMGVIIGTPTYNESGGVIGAVFLVKPLKEVNAALESLLRALLISLLGALALMLIPAYLASRGLSRPFRQLSVVAHTMAGGDFTVRADDKGSGEAAQLGAALNTLSSALSKTIGDLTLERNRLRSILDGMYEGIIAVDESLAVTHCNPSAMRLLGGTDMTEIESLTPFSTVLEVASKAVEEKGLSSKEYALGEAMLLFTAAPLFSEEETVAGSVVLIRDITESTRLENTRREYVANVSHELRTPLASIRSLADALCDGIVKKDEDKLRYYGYILKESMRLSRLIDDLLELSRLQSGNVALTKSRLNTAEFLQDVAERYREITGENDLGFAFELEENCPSTMTNPDRAEQVLVALLDNAVRYAPKGSDIRLSSHTEGDCVWIAVENPGHISETDLPHLFERFYKADKSHSGEGTGLGLSIAEEIMRLLGEQIKAENRENSVVFSFSLHRAQNE